MFTTPIQLPDFTHKLSIEHPIVAAGSCFAQVLGQRLQENKFNILVNPYGTIYNPIALFQLLQEALEMRLPAEETYLVRDEIHYNYRFHTSFYGRSSNELEKIINQTFQQTQKYLSQASHLILTLGTAFSYVKKDDQLLVSNCQKMPASLFDKQLADPLEITLTFERFFTTLLEINPNIQIILTVSPVRHLRDTLVQNSVSKSILRLAADQICRQFSSQITYFPSYEILLDELRDYRFYDEDMVHPSKTAENYIWSKFRENAIDVDSNNFINQWSKLSRAIGHRSFHPESPLHQRFLHKTIQALRQLSSIVNVEEEIKTLEQQLI